MFTVLCRHAHSYCQSIEAFVYGIGKSNVTKHGNILLSLTLKENTISNINTYPKGRALIKNVQSCPSNEKGNWRNNIY